MIIRLATSLSLLLLAGLALAGTDGTYRLKGGYYQIEVEFTEGGLVVKEPNKTSNYRKVGENLYEFPNAGKIYLLEVIDDSTLKASKRNSGDAPTFLELVGGSKGGDGGDKRFAGVADKYQRLAQTDGDNVQVWAFCAAAALARAQHSGDEADAYAAAAAAQLRLIMVDEDAPSPCPDAIDDVAWNAGQ
jgi:hypothetical protein